MSTSAPGQLDSPQGRHLHAQITQHLLDDMRAGRLNLGDKLPSQEEMVRKFKVSVTTVRRALAQLERQGVIRREQGRGSFVSLRSSGVPSSSETALRDVGLVFERTGRASDDPAESALVLAFSRICRERGVRLTCIETTFDGQLGGQQLIESFQGVAVQGVCAILHDPEGAAERVGVLGREFEAASLIVPGPCDDPLPIDCVDVSVRAGVDQLFEYLSATGHRRVAYVGPYIGAYEQGSHRVTSGRLQRYIEFVEQWLGGVDPSLMIESPATDEFGPEVRERVIELVRGSEPVTAIVAANDWLAAHLLAWLWGEGVRVPEEVSVAGFDDQDFAKFTSPPLTTVAFPFQAVVAAALDQLERQLVLPGRSAARMQLPTQLKIRKSVRSLVG